MKKTLSIVLCVLLVLLAVACSPETHKHTWDNGEKTLDATCTASGVVTYTCNVCGETDKKEIPALGHTHAEDATPVTIKRAANCLLEGSATYLCSRCNQEYQDVLAKDYTNHEYWDASENEGKGGYKPITKEDTKYYTWSTDAKVAKTQFTPASLVAYCNGCNKEISSITKAKETSDGLYEYDDILGTWVFSYVSKSDYSLLESDKAEAKYIFTVSKNTSNVYSVKGYEMGYSDTTKAWTTTDEKSGSSISFTVNDDKVRTFNFSLNSHTYALSEADGKYTLSVDAKTMYPVASTDSTKATATAKYLPDHTSHNITAMTHYGLTVIGSEAESGAAAGLGTSHYHYEECKDCGLAYHQVTISKGAEGKFDSDGLCKVCGAAQSATGWADVKIYSNSKLAKASAPILIVKAGTEIELPEGSYRVFNGLTYEIEEDTLWTLGDGLGVSGGKVVVSATGAEASFTDKVDD